MGGKWIAAIAAAVAASAVLPAAAQQAEQFVPSLVYRTGPFGPSGTDFADGFADYMTLLNVRDGGVNGVRLVVEEWPRLV